MRNPNRVTMATGAADRGLRKPMSVQRVDDSRHVEREARSEPMKRGLSLGWSLWLACLICGFSRGAVLLHEDWNSGHIDTSRWEYAGMPINSSLVDLGGGDCAQAG